MKLLKSKLDKASKKVMQNVNKHFKAKRGKGGWPLNYSFLVHDVFYEAFGYNLENHLLYKLLKKYNLESCDGELMVVKKQKGAKRAKV